jgi:hypothetical protein
LENVGELDMVIVGDLVFVLGRDDGKIEGVDVYVSLGESLETRGCVEGVNDGDSVEIVPG